MNNIKYLDVCVSMFQIFCKQNNIFFRRNTENDSCTNESQYNSFPYMMKCADIHTLLFSSTPRGRLPRKKTKMHHVALMTGSSVSSWQHCGKSCCHRLQVVMCWSPQVSYRGEAVERLHRPFLCSLNSPQAVYEHRKQIHILYFRSWKKKVNEVWTAWHFAVLKSFEQKSKSCLKTLRKHLSLCDIKYSYKNKKRTSWKYWKYFHIFADHSHNRPDAGDWY